MTWKEWLGFILFFGAVVFAVLNMISCVSVDKSVHTTVNDYGPGQIADTLTQTVTVTNTSTTDTQAEVEGEISPDISVIP